MKKRIDHKEPVILEDSPDDLFAPLDAGVPAIVSEPMVVPKLTMEQALSEPEPLLSTISASVIPMLTVEFNSFPADGDEAVRKDAFLWLRSKRQDLGVYKGMALDEESVIVTRVGGSRLLASYTAAGQWVAK